MFSTERYLAVFIRCAVLALTSFGLIHASDADEIVSGKFNLVDHHGNPVTESSYKDKFRLVFFGFTDCPLVCPTTMMEVAQVMRLLGDQGRRVQPLFISIDPAKDTVDRLATYV